MNARDYRYWIWPPVIMTFGLTTLHGLLRWLRYSHYFGMDNYWPVSIFLPKYPVWQDILTILGIGCMWWGFLRLWNSKKITIGPLVGIVMLLMVGTNALQGWHAGWITPIGSEDTDYLNYYHDVEGITSVPDLLAFYTTLQPTMRDHARVHPPGPLLLIHGLRSIWDNEAFMSMVFASAGCAGLLVIYYVLKLAIDERWALLTTALLGLLPSSQIYWLAGVDAVIMTFFLMCLWGFWQWEKGRKWQVLTIAALSVSALMTFAIVWLILVIVWTDWVLRKKISASISAIGWMVGSLYLFYVFTGYSYLDSFLVASEFEGPGGFYAFTAPLSYISSRIENVLELVIFAGPYITMIVWGHVRKWQSLERLGEIGTGALIGLGLFFVSGAYYTGETARAAGYIFPWILMICGEFFAKTKPQLKTELLLLNLVFGQTVLMQLFGWYGW